MASGYWATPDPWVILFMGLVMVGAPAIMFLIGVGEDRRLSSCQFITNGGMHCSGKRRHDGPHTFTNREWHRTRHSANTGGGTL